MKGTWRTDSGGGGLVLAVIIVVIVAGSGSAVASAITGLLVTVAIVFGSVIGLAVLGGIGWLVYRARQDRPGAAIAARPASTLPSVQRPQLEVSDKPAIGPGREVHYHFHVSAEELAAILRHYTEENQ
jgi:hypothetical protein